MAPSRSPSGGQPQANATFQTLNLSSTTPNGAVATNSFVLANGIVVTNFVGVTFAPAWAMAGSQGVTLLTFSTATPTKPATVAAN